MQKTFLIELQKLGLSPKEAQIYSAVLEKKILSPAAAARITGQKRTTAYHALHALQQLGLIVEEKTNNRMYYRAEPPTVWRERIKKQAERVEKTLPLLRELFGSKMTDPTVEYFRGSAVTTVFDRMLTTKEKLVFVFRPYKDIEQIAGREFHFAQRRLKAGIVIKYLEARDHPHPPNYSQGHKERLREVRQLPAGTTVPSTVLIWDDSVAWVAPNERVAALQTSRDYSQFMRMVFSTLWEISKKI